MSAFENFDKVLATISSCKTLPQLEVAHKMLQLFRKHPSYISGMGRELLQVYTIKRDILRRIEK